MVRPKKPRLYDGVPLADNLYRDPKKRIGFWQYKLPDGKNRTFKADTVQKANEAAELANAKREEYVPEKNKEGLTPFGYQVERFIENRESTSPELKRIRSWKNRCYAMRKFGREVTLSPRMITRKYILGWWDELSYHNQKLVHSEFRKLFNFLAGEGLIPQFEYNPFTTSDEKPRLYLKSKPSRKRERLDQAGFWKIYQSAGNLGYEGLQVAMGLSLITFMREQDILTLRLDQHVKGSLLQRVISKSEAQKGYAKAARLEWNIDSQPALKTLIQKARELSLKNGRCPFLVSHMPKRLYKSNIKDHAAQITRERISEQFKKSREATGLWKGSKHPPTFHEVRSLGDALATSAGFDIKVIQHAMAHSDEAMTQMYQAGHDLPFEEVKIVFTESMIGGNFS